MSTLSLKPISTTITLDRNHRINRAISVIFRNIGATDVVLDENIPMAPGEYISYTVPDGLKYHLEFEVRVAFNTGKGALQVTQLVGA